MNVKNRSLAIVCCVILCLSGFFLFEGISRYNKSLDALLSRDTSHIDTIVDDINRFSLAPYLVRIKHITEEHPDITAAFAQGDREQLYELTHHEYQVLHRENKYFQSLNFILPDGTVFLRVQQPTLFGDNHSEQSGILHHIEDNRNPLACYDLTGTGAVYRIIYPLYSQGRCLGTMEFGISIKQVLDAITARLGSPVASVLHGQPNDTLLDTSDFKIRDDQAQIISNSPVFARIPGYVSFEQEERLNIDGRIYLLHNSSKLRDFAGRDLGHIVALQDITEHIEKKRHFIIRTVIIALLLSGLVFAFIWFTMGNLVERLENYARENSEARDELQKAHDHLEKRVEERTNELAEQHAFLHNILESLTNPFYVIDADTYAIVLANEAAYALSDRDRNGLTCYQLTHNQESPCSGEHHACALKMVKKSGEPAKIEHFHCGRAGEGRYYEVYAYPIFDHQGRVRQVIEYNIDITERRKAEEEKKEIWNQLLQSQKMEAVGVLAGGVAHDFNNVLTAIIGNAHLAIVKGGDCKERVGHYLEQIMKSSNRAVSLVRQLLLFSRQQGIEEFDPMDLNWTIENLLKMLDRLIGENIEIKTALAPDLWTIKADKVNLEQVITNLVVNARDAMPEGGEIIISTKNLGIDASLEKQIDNARLGNYVSLSVTDTGKGMDGEDLEKIFEPFYTTKEAGRGTGLGLSIVRGVAEQHGGWVNVYSERGKGTIFNIYLPAAIAEEPVDQGITDLEKTLSYGALGEGYRVLLVEDEADVRAVTLNILENMGFTVTVAENCQQARKYMDDAGRSIDLLFSDVALPDGKGVELALDFLKRYPDLKVLMTSGYPDHRSRLSIIRMREMHFILKPYGLTELEQLLWEILNPGALPPEPA